jgi:hypothetical protein
MWISSETGYTQPRGDNWVATLLRSRDLIKKMDINSIDGA